MCRFYYDVILGLVFWSFDEPVSFNYSKDKEKWVTFNNGKDKMKLRKFIHKKSSNLLTSIGNEEECISLMINEAPPLFTCQLS